MALLPELNNILNTRVGVTAPAGNTQSSPTSFGSFLSNTNTAAPTNNTQVGGGVVRQVTQSSGAVSPGGGGDSRAQQLQKMASSGGLNPSQQAEYDALTGVNSAVNDTRNAINSGYDAYFSQLDDVLNNSLPQQRSAQDNIANSQYSQGVSSLDSQKALGQQDLQTQRDKATTQQSKTIQDLTDNIRNLFQSGNVYLGARGAADSSAGNQYSYALTKMGSQQRGDVTNQYAQINNDINGRESRLKEVYNGQVKDLGFQRDQQINNIAQWFSQQQNALKQAQAQGQLQKGQDLASLSKDLLNTALTQLQQVQQQHQSATAALQQWAMNHSTDINSLKQNLASVSDTNYAMPGYTPVNGSPSVGGGNAAGLFGFANGGQQRTNIFGQPIG